MTDNNVINISYKDAHTYVDILESIIKIMIKQDPLDQMIEEYKALLNRMNIAIHTYHHSK